VLGVTFRVTGGVRRAYLPDEETARPKSCLYLTLNDVGRRVGETARLRGTFPGKVEDVMAGKPIISDADVDVLVAIGIVVVGLPIWLVHRTWTFLRTGRFPYP
jgi:hypothetical protein